jgi:hypothetical protein
MLDGIPKTDIAGKIGKPTSLVGYRCDESGTAIMIIMSKMHSAGKIILEGAEAIAKRETHQLGGVPV